MPKAAGRIGIAEFSEVMLRQGLNAECDIAAYNAVFLLARKPGNDGFCFSERFLIGFKRTH
jgi:hypothetical protein